MEAMAVVGDVHGDSKRLRELLRRLDTFRGRVVFVGDYVNGGPDSAEVVEILADLSENAPERFVFLCGNHDLSLLAYYDDGDFAAFVATGGISTLSSYLPVVSGDVHAALRAALPRRHVAFLRGLAPYWESDDCLVSHSGFDPVRPHLRDLETMAHPKGWRVFDALRYPRSLVVCGHYVQTREPFDSVHLICVDTGCGILQDGRLTAVLLPDRRFLTIP
jgi:serine/threonine protein phosphatase 1